MLLLTQAGTNATVAANLSLHQVASRYDRITQGFMMDRAVEALGVFLVKRVMRQQRMFT